MDIFKSYDYFYNDIESDLLILNIAKTAYVVEGNKLIPYVKGYKFKNKNWY